jgi:hypothetical protein
MENLENIASFCLIISRLILVLFKPYYIILDLKKGLNLKLTISDQIFYDPAKYQIMRLLYSISGPVICPDMIADTSLYCRRVNSSGIRQSKII